MILESYEAIKTSQGEKSALTGVARKRALDLYLKWKKPDLAAQYRA